jgi:uncharacterized protein YndB with AHSA1/START domain
MNFGGSTKSHADLGTIRVTLERTPHMVKDFVIARDFDAPRPLLFSCFTEVDRLAKWWGPKGFRIIRPKLDFRPGGMFHYGMESGQGNVMWGRMMFREITPPERIVFINSFSDEHGGLARAPFFDDKWPLEILTHFDFAELGPNRSRFTVTWTPCNATEEEQAMFDANHASMNGGWTGTLDQLAEYVATQKAKD